MEAIGMNSAVELPGEANPLSLPELGRALRAATSNDHAQRQTAGKQLEAWETHEDYFTSLQVSCRLDSYCLVVLELEAWTRESWRRLTLLVDQTAFLDKSLTHEIRFLAIILLKNGIGRYWRPTTRHSITPPQKQLIRSRLLQGSVQEEDRSLALHNALVVAKIVRTDYPNDWPDAFATLINLIRATQHENQAELGGALLILLHVVKEMGTARLARSQKALRDVTPELVGLLGEVYVKRTEFWMGFLTKGQGDEDDADLAMNNSLTSLRILRRLVIIGYDSPEKHVVVQEFWSLSQTQFDQFLRIVNQDSHVPAPFQDIVGKHLMQFTKLHIKTCQEHAASFPVLPNSIPLVRAYWALVKDFAEVFEKSGGIKQTSSGNAESKAKFEGPLLEQIALKGLLLFRCCMAIAHQPVQTFKYRNVDAKDLEKAAIEAVKSDLLTDELLMDIVQVIISRLFIFRKSDLETWEEDPEEWESQEKFEGQAWEWAVRPCAERLLMDLLTHYGNLGKPLLSYCQLATQVDMDVVTKEAAYCALGCASAYVHEAFDFNHFLTTTLVKDVQLEDSMAKLLRRRVAILISQWISIGVSDSSQPVVFEIFRHLMNPADKHNDQVVRITAARQLNAIANAFEFDSEKFLPFAATFFDLLVNLLAEVNLDEIKLAILKTMRMLVVRLETDASHFGDAIMTTLPKLWETADAGEYMMKQAILAITTSLVEAMRTQAQRYHNLMIPLLREALNPDSSLHLYLIEESVELWSMIMMQSNPPLTADLLQLVELALPLLEYDSDVTRKCLEIVRSYVILEPESILAENLRRPVLTALSKTLKSRSRDQVRLGATSIEFMLQFANHLGGSQGTAILVQDMLEVGLLRTIMEDLHDAWETHESTGPFPRISRIDSLKETDYFVLLARVAIADPSVFASMLASFADSSGTGSDGTPEGAVVSVWQWLSKEWFASVDFTGDVERMKLSCLALTRLAELPFPAAQKLVLTHLQDYLSLWTSAVLELRPDSDSGPTVDYLAWTTGPETTTYDTPLDEAERVIAVRDPVHTVNTYDFIMQRLADLVQRAGGEQAFEAEWAVNVDKEILTGFQKLSQPQPTQ